VQKISAFLSKITQSTDEHSRGVISYLEVRDFPELDTVWKKIQSESERSQMIIVDDLAMKSQELFIDMVVGLINGGLVVNLVFKTADSLERLVPKFTSLAEISFKSAKSKDNKNQAKGRLMVTYVQSANEAASTLSKQTLSFFKNKYSTKELGV